MGSGPGQIQTYILRRSCLQIHSSVEKLIKNRHDAVLLEQWCQASKEPQQKLECSPIARVERLLTHGPCATKYLLCNTAVLAICVEHGTCNERNLEWLLNDPVTVSDLVQ